MAATKDELADGSKPILKSFVEDPKTYAMESSRECFNAIYERNRDWVKKWFDVDNALKFKRSMFIESVDGTKKLSTFPAHFLVHAPPGKARHQTRFLYAEDWLFRIKLLLANNYITLDEAEEHHKTLQSFLMNLTYSEIGRAHV